MATHDYVLSNQSGSSFRTDLNNALAAIVSGNSASSEPSTTYAYMIWNDTSNGLRKIRNSANNGWITLSTLTGGNTFDDDVTFTGASYNVVWDKSDNALEFADNAKCTFGASDLQIYHDGSTSYIDDAGTGNLYLRGSASIELRKAGSTEKMLYAEPDAAVELYYDSVKVFATEDNGIYVYGPEGGIASIMVYADRGDDNADKWRMSALTSSSLFRLYNFNDGGWETSLECNGSGAVKLDFDNSTKFETLSGGAKVTGTLIVVGDDVRDDGYKSKWGTSDDMQLFHEGGTTSRFNFAADHTLVIKEDTNSYFQFDGSNNYAWSKTVVPWADDTFDIGTSSYRWDNIYATSGTVSTSDRNEKNTIIDSDLGLSFINKLKPVSYKFNGRTRTHYGLIAQDVETVLSDISKSTTDFAGFIKTDLPDEPYDAIRDENDIPEGKKVGDVKIPAHASYGLRYNEFVAPLIKAIQELSAKVEALEAK